MSGRAASDAGPSTWRPWLAIPRFQSSAILRECGELLSEGWRGSFSGSDYEFWTYTRSSFKMATIPISIQSKPHALPSDDSLRLDKEQCRAPIVPQSRKPDPQDTVSPAETQPTPTARTLQGPEADAGVQESLLAEQRELGNNLAERRVRSAWSGKATGRDSVNATIQ